MAVAPAADSSASAAIELCAVVKEFSIGLRGLKQRALDGVNLRVERGEVFGLLGPNGSGKSTAIKAILGLVTPTSGHCSVLGEASTTPAVRRRIGYLPESPAFYAFLTARELVRFYGRMCDLRGDALEDRVEAVLSQMEMNAAADRRIGTFSRGMLQRVGLAQALVHDPEILILDEPTGGLDPLGSAAVSELIATLKAKGKTLLVTSHLLAQMEEVCDRIAILERGRVILEGRVPDVLGEKATQRFEMEALSPRELTELRAWLAARGRKLEVVEPKRARLDELFVARVGRERKS